MGFNRRFAAAVAAAFVLIVLVSYFLFTQDEEESIDHPIAIETTSTVVAPSVPTEPPAPPVFTPAPTSTETVTVQANTPPSTQSPTPKITTTPAPKTGTTVSIDGFPIHYAPYPGYPKAWGMTECTPNSIDIWINPNGVPYYALRHEYVHALGCRAGTPASEAVADAGARLQGWNGKIGTRPTKSDYDKARRLLGM